MRLEVVRGPLKGVRGVLRREDKWHRLVVAKHRIKQAAAVKIDAADVILL